MSVKQYLMTLFYQDLRTNTWGHMIKSQPSGCKNISFVIQLSLKMSKGQRQTNANDSWISTAITVAAGAWSICFFFQDLNECDTLH